jgi:predicted O-methyltransferase YrrM
MTTPSSSSSFERGAFLARLEQELRGLSLESLRQEGASVTWEEFLGRPGREHYALLAHLSTRFSGRDLFDIGTHKGASALALSYAPENRVLSFDVESGRYELPRRDNVEYHVCDLWSEEGRALWRERLLASAFVFLDIDPHEGARELEFVAWLRQEGYRGFVVCDDIFYFKPMRDAFWYQIPFAEKLDLTPVGHWSGTGMVRFEASELWPALPPPTNWTVVTAYFDLTREQDASQEIRDRPAEHYLANANTTLATSQNLVVYCDPESVGALLALRPAHLLERTRVVPCRLSDFPLSVHREEVEANRRARPSADSRNTVSYYLFCLARYAMLKRAVAENAFGSMQFAWCNVCIERMGWRNAAALEEVWEEQRQRLSCAYIDYIPRSLLQDEPTYWLWGRCSFCSGFWTADRASMLTFCDRIEAKFLEYLRKGYGHADEQLFSPVFFEDPELFDWYPADYQEMVCNYREPRHRAHVSVRHLLRNSLEAGDVAVAARAATKLTEAWEGGHTDLTAAEAEELQGLAARVAFQIAKRGLP